MPRKTLQLQVELHIQAVTCPGVWLCPNGKVSLQVYLLDSCIQTTALQPTFPLYYQEKFAFYKTFYTAHSLGDLQRAINKESLYAELIQWKYNDIGNVLATFQTCLTEVLYPTTQEGASAGVDVDLLMEPSKNFPGIIAPKIEISTKTAVEEIVCISNDKKCNSFVVNPKTITSDFTTPAKYNQLHQRKVCHSIGYHKSKRCNRLKKSSKPPFVFRRAEEDLLIRKPQGLESGSTEKCKCCIRSQSSEALTKKVDFSATQSSTERTYSKLTDEFLKQYPKPTKGKGRQAYQGKQSNKKSKSTPSRMCQCGSGHTQENCPVCSKYNTYFEGSFPCSCASSVGTPHFKTPPMRESYVRKLTASSSTREPQRQSSRSPIKTLSKDQQHHYQSAAYKIKPCMPPKRFSRQEQQPQETDVTCNCCDCITTISNDDDQFTSNRRCSCTMRKRPTLAEQIHQRLKQTLDSVPNCTFVNERSDEVTDDSPRNCSCSRIHDYKEGLYQNFGKFYRDLCRC